MDPVGREALLALRRVVKAAELSANDLSARTLLTPSQSVVMQIIAHEGETDAGTISEAARLTQGAITPILDRLEDLKLIVRERDPADRRRAKLRLTAAGTQLAEDLPNGRQGSFLARFEKLDDWMQHGLVAALELLAQLLESDAENGGAAKTSRPRSTNPKVGAKND